MRNNSFISRIFRFFLEKSIKNDNYNLYYWILKIRYKILKINLELKKVSIKESKGFSVKDLKSGLIRYFIIKRQGFLSYNYGFSQRAKILGEDIYMLNKVDYCNDNNIIIDIGANNGDLNLYFKLKKISFKYFAFEPGLFEFKCLEQNLKGENNCNFFQIALGNKSGILDFYYKPENGDSSLIEISNYSEKFPVEVKTLDKIIEELGLKGKLIKLVKLEAEGFEPEILYGGINSLKNIQYITADLGFERGINEETTSPDVINFLLSNNFEILSQSITRNVFLFKSKILID